MGSDNELVEFGKRILENSYLIHVVIKRRRRLTVDFCSPLLKKRRALAKMGDIVAAISESSHMLDRVN